jgi:hypothetical protein
MACFGNKVKVEAALYFGDRSVGVLAGGMTQNED